MKKLVVVLLLVVSFCVGCDKIKELINGKEDRTAEYLLNKYVEGYLESNEKIIKDIFPDFYYNAFATRFSKDNMILLLAKDKNKYGNDFTFKFVIESNEKLSSEELKKINDNITNDIHFNTTTRASECYHIKGNAILTGSIQSNTSAFEAYRCMYDGTWYISFD